MPERIGSRHWAVYPARWEGLPWNAAITRFIDRYSHSRHHHATHRNPRPGWLGRGY